MVRFSAEDFRRILTKIRGLKARVYFYFKDFKYLLTIDGLVRARDKNLDVVRWSIVFGSKTPHEVLNSLNVLDLMAQASLISRQAAFFA